MDVATDIESKSVGRDRRTRSDGTPTRMCVGCRERAKALSLVRLVCDSGGAVQVDLRQKMPGRGAYLHLRRQCLDTAVKRQALRRSFGEAVRLEAPDRMFEQMAQAVEKRTLERLGLARRAGGVESGSEAVRRAMKSNRARLVWLATDASDSTRTQLAANCERKRIPKVRWFEGRRLAQAVGLTFLSALAVTSEPFASELTVLGTCLEESALGRARGRHE